MFGIWRLCLAMIVVYSHLGSSHDTEMGWTGYYAVRSFFILSGYLMTLIMNEKYHYTARGIGRFALNRFLRIYPSYYAAMGCSILLLLIFGEANVSSFQSKIRWPMTWGELWPNLTLVGLTNQAPVRFVPPAWALDIELVYYLLIALGLGASRGIGLVWWSLSALFYLVPNLSTQMGFPECRYLPSSIDFATGSMVYHVRTLLGDRAKIPDWMVASSLVLWCVPFISCGLGLTDPYSKALTIHRLATAGVVFSLAGVRAARHSYWAKLDKSWGDLSYPVYLLHWQCGFLCAAMLPMPRDSWLMLAMSSVTVLAVARLEVLCLSGPIESFRHKATPPHRTDAAPVEAITG